MGKVLNIKCKYCGKYGIKATELKLTGGSIPLKQTKNCHFCKELNLHNEDYGAWGDFAWENWKEKGLTKGDIYKSKLAKIISISFKNDLGLSANEITEFFLSSKIANIKNVKKFQILKNKKNKIKEKKSNIKKDEIDKIKHKISSGVSSSFNLIPESIWGILAYVLLIIVCIYVFGDGPECGVDFAPRFFGEC